MFCLKTIKNFLYKSMYAATAAVLIAGLASACAGPKATETQSNTVQTAAVEMTQEDTIPQTHSAEAETSGSVFETDVVAQTEVSQTHSTQPEQENRAYHLDLLSEKSLESYDSARVKEIIMEPEGNSFVFWSEKTFTDLKLIRVDYDGDQFMEKEILCSYDTFTAEDALLITHFFSEEIADLKLTFYDEMGQLQTLYMTQDGKNMTPVLVLEADLLF